MTTFLTALKRTFCARHFALTAALLPTLPVLTTPLAAQDMPGGHSTPVFTPSDIKSEIAYLASDELRGRGSGEPGNDRAAQYVARAFAKAGLKPLGTARERVPNAPLDGSGYYQPFTFVAGRTVGSKNLLELWYGEGVHRAGVTFTSSYYAPSSVSAASGPGISLKVQGQIVFVGYGIQAAKAGHDDYANISVKGKVVMMLAGSPKDDPHSPLADYADIYRKATTARDLGAAAVLVVLPKSANTLQTPHAGFDNAEDAGIPVMRARREIADMLLDFPHKTLAGIQQKADAGENTTFAFPADYTLNLQTDVRKVEKVTANVVGMIEGSDPVLKNEYVVIGAHMDHLGMGGAGSLAASKVPAIHHGADDNASGTAGVMQLAQYFGEGKRDEGGRERGKEGKSRSGGYSFPPSLTTPSLMPSLTKRSIILMCFSGEELGLFGSDWYVKHPVVPLDKTVAMLNMDMVGRLRDNKLTVIGSGTATEWNGLLDDLNKTTGFVLARSESGFGASDQQSFYTKNVPVLFFFTGTHPQYHTPQDTVDLINAQGEAKVLSLVADCARRVANAPSRPTFQRIQTPEQNAPSRGLRVYFGSVPDYAAQVEGVQLNGVREGSPAEKAGLKAGDIITKFGDKIIKNVYDYTYALQDHKPGDVVQVAVTRGAQSLTLTVTLTARPE